MTKVPEEVPQPELRKSRTLPPTPILTDDHWQMVHEAAVQKVPDAKRMYVAWVLSLVLLGLMDAEAFEKAAGMSLDDALRDDEIAEYAETLAARPENIARAERIKLRDATSTSLAALDRVLKDPSATPAQVVAASEALGKVKSMIEGGALDVPSLTRELRIMLTTAAVNTPLRSLTLRLATVDDLHTVVEAMCCTSEWQVKTVVAALRESADARFIGGGVTLSW